MADGTLKFRKKNPNWKRGSAKPRSRILKPRPNETMEDIFIRHLETMNKA